MVILDRPMKTACILSNCGSQATIYYVAYAMGSKLAAWKMHAIKTCPSYIAKCQILIYSVNMALL